MGFQAQTQQVAEHLAYRLSQLLDVTFSLFALALAEYSLRPPALPDIVLPFKRIEHRLPLA